MCSVRNTAWSSRHSSPTRALCLALLLLLVPVTQARAFGDYVTVSATVSALLDLEPGSTSTASFMVGNRTSRRVELTEKIVLPGGWQVIIGGSSFALSPGEERLRLTTFHVPLSAPAGSRTLTYEVTDRSRSGLLGSDEVELGVLACGDLELIPGDSARRVAAGNALATRFAVVNRSNVGGEILVSLTSSESYPVNADALDFFLGAGESREIAVTVETPENIARTTGHALRIDAAMSGFGAVDAAASATVVQEIIPRVSERYDPYHRVPAALRAVYVGGEDGGGVQLEFAGRGGLDADGSNTVAFTFRTPDTRDESVLGLRDEYTLSFQGRSYDVQAGDGVYELTRLTGQRLLGRGGSLGLDLGGWRLAGSYFGTRSGAPAEERGIARLGHHRGDSFSMDLSYVRTQPDDGDILSVAGALRPFPWFGVDLEYAGQADRIEEGAYWVRVKGSRGGARYFFERIGADEDFTGRFSDEHHTAGSVNLPLFAGARVSAQFRDYDNRDEQLPQEDEDGEPILSQTTQERARSVGLRSPITSSIRATADYRHVRREGRTTTANFDYRTETTRLALDWVGSSFTAVNSLELGRLDDRTSGTTSDVTRYALLLNLRPSSGWRVSGHFESALSGSPDPSNSSDVAGLDGELRPNSDLELEAGVQWRGLGEDSDLSPDEFTARAEYTMPSRHKISGEVRWVRFSGASDPEAAVRFSYELPFGTPVARRKDVGSLRGSVFDAEADGLPGLADVVLMLNDLSAATDDRGDYVFPSLEPGVYHLTVDPRSIGFGKVPTVGLPRQIVISGGEELVFEFGVTRPGSISGEVLLDGAADACLDGWSTSGTGGSPALLVEASSDDQVLRQLTDSQGRFSFDRLRPGRWVVVIHEDGLPRFHDLEESDFVVEVLPGNDAWVEARVKDPGEVIPIIETGDVRVSGIPR